MIRTNLFEDSSVHKIIASAGCFCVREYEKDISVAPEDAVEAYFTSEMNIRKKQVIAALNGNGIVIQSGAMQMMIGQVHSATNVKGPCDLVRKFMGSKVTGESAIKPRYEGDGIIVLEPTYKYILFEDLADWQGQMVIEDGMFLACDDTADVRVSARKSISSVVLGNEGLFNTSLKGKGIVVLESPVPSDELIVVDLENDSLKIDGDMAIAWSQSLDFTVERTTGTLVGSAASGEGLVNVFRGTGRVLVAPVACHTNVSVPAAPQQETK